MGLCYGPVLWEELLLDHVGLLVLVLPPTEVGGVPLPRYEEGGSLTEVRDQIGSFVAPACCCFLFESLLIVCVVCGVWVIC